MRGALYVIGADALPRDILVSVCPDKGGKPDDARRVGSTRLTIASPLDMDKQHPRRVAFSVRCELAAGAYYWLILEAGWSEVTVNIAGQDTKAVTLACTDVDSRDVILRKLTQAEGPAPGDLPDNTGVLAELELLAPAKPVASPDPSP